MITATNIVQNLVSASASAVIYAHESTSRPSNHSSSFYVVSPASIRSQIKQWNSELPKVIPHYAVKSNPDGTLLRELYRGGVKFDCASGREIRDCEAFSGVGMAVTKDIIFANPTKTESDMRLAASHGITETVVDSPEEVWRIAQVTGWRPSIFIRLAVADKASRSPFSIKFGAERRSWRDIVAALKITGLKLAGLSFHIGSACSDAGQYKKAIDECRKFVHDTKHPVDAVDIGGGFIPETFHQAAAVIRDSMRDWEMSSTTPAPKRWIAEPGRFFSAASPTLYTRVISAKQGPKGVGWRYTLDVSIYGQFSCIPFDHQRPYWWRVGGSRARCSRGFLFGRTCDSLDLIAFSEKMPELRDGDWLCFPGMGAYTTSSSSEFNGFPRPYVYYQDEGWLNPNNLTHDSSIIFPIETKSSIKLALS